jgi:hypothetical protein
MVIVLRFYMDFARDLTLPSERPKMLFMVGKNVECHQYPFSKRKAPLLARLGE